MTEEEVFDCFDKSTSLLLGYGELPSTNSSREVKNGWLWQRRFVRDDDKVRELCSKCSRLYFVKYRVHAYIIGHAV